MVVKLCALRPPYNSGKARLACINREQPGTNVQPFAVKIMHRSDNDLWAVIWQPNDVLLIQSYLYEIFNHYHTRVRCALCDSISQPSSSKTPIALCGYAGVSH